MTLASASVQEISPSRSSSRMRALKLSMSPFSRGLPGAIEAVLAPTAAIRS
jgi:hypothetical protein